MTAEPNARPVVQRADTRLPVGGVVKGGVEAIFTVLALPIAGWYHGWASIAPSRADVTMQGVSQLVGLVPGVLGGFLRRAVYRLTLRRCGAGVSVGFGTIIATADVEIGDGVYIGPFCNIGHAAIGDDTLLGSNVTLLGGTRQHGIARLDIPIRHQPGEYRRISVGRDVWIGNGAIVADDVGDQSVIGAGAVVTKPIPGRSVAVGNPARVIAERGTGDA